MRSRRAAWAVGSVALALAGSFGDVACGTDNGQPTGFDASTWLGVDGSSLPAFDATTSPVPSSDAALGVDAGDLEPDGASGEGDDAGDAGDAGNANDAGDSGDAEVSADCGKLPTLHQAGAGPYCPFTDAGNGTQGFVDCSGAQHCCEYQATGSGTQGSLCEPNGTACPGAASFITVDWACDTASQCADAGSSCCMFGKDAGNGGTTSVVSDNTCAAVPNPLLKGLNVGGTACETACGAGEVKLCASDSDCAGALHCVAFNTNGKQLGVCH